jgi:hypothetical protein
VGRRLDSSPSTPPSSTALARAARSASTRRWMFDQYGAIAAPW